MTTEQHWYVQSGSRVKGPYSTTEVGRYLLLGRVRSSDRVSKDGELWEPVTQVPELIPEELLDLDSEQGWSQYLSSRSQFDERSSDSEVVLADRREISTHQTVEKVRDEWVPETIRRKRRFAPNLLPVSLLCVSLAALLAVIFLNSIGGNGLG